MIAIFAGPTLDSQARATLSATYFPPAAQGDVFKVARKKPKVIGIIDGLFDSMPSVWHKEILWALSQGVHVIGASSMGALRAAELHEFGMTGIGKIFEMYRDGIIEDDDEVAVMHAEAGEDHAIFAHAMVDIRRSVDDARSAEIISAESARTITQCAKAMFFRERTYFNIMQAALELGASPDEIADLRLFLQRQPLSQKQEDAVAMIDFIAANIEKFAQPFEPGFIFENTTIWNDFRLTHAGIAASEDVSSSGVTLDAILDELRLHFGRGEEILKDAFLRLMSIREADRSDRKSTASSIATTAESFRRELGLLDAEDLQSWRAVNDLQDSAQMRRFLRDQADVYSVTEWLRPNSRQHIVDSLRAKNLFGPVITRARAKASFIASSVIVDARFDDNRLGQAIDWLASQRGDQDLDVRSEDAHKLLGYADRDEFAFALLKEFEFQMFVRKSESVTPLGPSVLQGVKA